MYYDILRSDFTFFLHLILSFDPIVLACPPQPPPIPARTQGYGVSATSCTSPLQERYPVDY